MPRTGHHFTFEFSLAEWSAPVGARVVGREEGSIDIKDSDFPSSPTPITLRYSDMTPSIEVAPGLQLG